MRNRLLVALAILLAVGTAGAVVFGGDAVSLLQTNSGDSDAFPTETTSQEPTPGDQTTASGGSGDDGSGSDDDGSSATTTTSLPPFTFDIVSVEECGETCRDVTITLTNQQETTARNVTVYTRIFAGQGTDGDVVWTGSEPVGTLAPGESTTRTKRVDLSLSGAFAVQQADGWITIQTTVQSQDETMTFTEQRDVI